MDYLRHITTEHSTYTEAAPKQTVMLITKGRIVGGWLFFPSGPAGTLHVVVRRGIHQVFPVDPGNSYALDDCVIPLFGGVEITQPPLQLEIITWNTSTTYNHTLTLCLFLDPFSDPRTRKNWLSRILGKND